FAGKKSAQIREILINESAWEEMTCLFALSLIMSAYSLIIKLYHKASGMGAFVWSGYEPCHFQRGRHHVTRSSNDIAVCS
ncbi:hypothetical protein ACVZC4_27020, partial [Klebsiella pneumoniae]